jgi:hypothetical protein
MSLQVQTAAGAGGSAGNHGFISDGMSGLQAGNTSVLQDRTMQA